MEVNYTKLATYVFLINVLLYLIFRAYHWLVVIDDEKDTKIYQQVITIKILGDAFLFISSSAYILFGSISVIGKILDYFAKAIGMDKAISMEESFLINFIILFGYVGIVFMNGIYKDLFKQFEANIGKMKKKKDVAQK